LAVASLNRRAGLRLRLACLPCSPRDQALCGGLPL